MISDAQPRADRAVAVWCDYWLPYSETFIAHQVASLQRWSPVRIGYANLAEGLPVAPDFAPFTRSLQARVERRLWGVRARLRQYCDYLARREVLLVHAHFAPGGLNALPIVRETGLPLVVTFHGYDVTRLVSQPGPAGRRYRRRLRDLFDSSARLVAVSHHIRERLVNLGADEEKVRVVYTGARSSDVNGSEVPHPPARSGIVFVGRLVEKKGAEDLIRAVMQLPDGLRRTRVTVLGEGSESARLIQLAQSAGANVVFKGRTTEEEVVHALTAAAVFCGPSKTARDGDTEGLPSTLVEAAHHGAPIVSTSHAGIPEFLRHGQEALLVEEGDVASLAAALTRVLTDHELRDRLSLAARRRARAHFDVATCTSVLENVYDEVALVP